MSIYILVRGLTEGVSLKKVILSPCWLFSSWEIPPIRFILIPFIQKRRVFTFCECLSIFSLFLSGDETTNLAQKNSFSYLGTSSSTFNRTTRQEYLLIIGVIIAGLDFLSTCHNVTNDCQ